MEKNPNKKFEHDFNQSYVEWTGDQITLLKIAQKKVMVTHARQQSSTKSYYPERKLKIKKK